MRSRSPGGERAATDIHLAARRVLDVPKRSLARLRKRFSNAARAFRPYDTGYRLALGEFAGFRVAYREGSADEAVLGSLETESFFASVPAYVPSPADTIIDVGAHIGTFALLAARRVPAGRVFAIEASRETFDYLTVNVALNRLENVQLSHLALSDRAGRARLHYDRGNWGHSIMARLSSHGEEVATQSLGGYMAEMGITRCDLIKFNCEGAEFPILMGAGPEVLRRIRRMLVLYHLDLAYDYSLDALVAHLRASGFRSSFLQRRRRRGALVAERVEPASGADAAV